MQREATPSKAKPFKLKQRVSKQSKATQSNVKQSKAKPPSMICPSDARADRSPKILFLGSVRQSLLRNVIYPIADVFSGIRPLGTLADISSKTLYRASVRKTLLRKGHQRYFLWDLSARAFCGQMINLMHSIAKQGKVKQRQRKATQDKTNQCKANQVCAMRWHLIGVASGSFY